MKIKTIVLNLNPQSFIKRFVNHAHILFRESEYNIESINAGTITVKLAEKHKPDFDKEIQVTCINGHERDQTYIIFDVIQTFGYKNMISPSFNVAAWLHHNFQCNHFADIDTNKEVNILGKTGGCRMSMHTSEIPMRHDLGVFSI